MGNPALSCLQSKEYLLLSGINAGDLIWDLSNVCYREIVCYSGMSVKDGN